MMKAKSDLVCDGKWQSFESEAVKEMLKSRPVTIDMRTSILSLCKFRVGTVLFQAPNIAFFIMIKASVFGLLFLM